MAVKSLLLLFVMMAACGNLGSTGQTTPASIIFLLKIGPVIRIQVRTVDQYAGNMFHSIIAYMPVTYDLFLTTNTEGDTELDIRSADSALLQDLQHEGKHQADNSTLVTESEIHAADMRCSSISSFTVNETAPINSSEYSRCMPCSCML